MQRRHTDRALYFREQGEITRKHVLPFIEAHKPLSVGARVLEIGCGEGGNLVPFLERGCECVGVDLDAEKMANARRFFGDQPAAPEALLTADIQSLGPDDIGRFDLIVMRDVIEHISDRPALLRHMRGLLRPGGRAFFGYPPWQMPFGGHHQGCRNPLLAHLPYLHLLPAAAYRGLLQWAGEPRWLVEYLMEVRATALTIEAFREALAQTRYRVEREQLYLINPGYETKFGLVPLAQLPVLGRLPVVRNFVTTCAYVVAAPQ